MSIPESHLAQEAIAALVDGELPPGPARRAAGHLSGCLQCRMAVQAQREAKEALHRSQEVAVPGDLLSRLCAIPFTADVPGSGGSGTLAAGPDSLTVSGASGSWAVSLRPHRSARSDTTARWLRRGVTGTLAGLGLGFAALALSLPATGAAGGASSGPVARPSVPEEHTEVVPPVVRTLTVGHASTVGNASPTTSAPGGTP